MNFPSTGNEAPSIIQEIIIYNKPGLKNSLLNTTISINNGDIVITQSKRPGIAKTNVQSGNISVKLEREENLALDIKQESLECEKINNVYSETSEEQNSSIEPLNNFFEYESLESPAVDHYEVSNFTESIETSDDTRNDEVLEAHEIQHYDLPDVQTEASEPSETNLNPPVAENVIQPEPLENTLESLTTSESSESNSSAPVTSTPFKRPRGRPKKSIVTNQKNTLNSFVVRVSTDNIPDSQNESENKTSEDNKAEDKSNVTYKRPRGRPKKSVNNTEKIISHDSENDFNDIDQENSKSDNAPKKRGRKRKIEIQACDKDVQAGKKVKKATNSNSVEDELQVMFTDTEATEDSPQYYFIKQEQGQISLINQENDEQSLEHSNSESLATGSDNEDYNSDEDSRQEWMPEEYVEYKQQHQMKQAKKMFPCKYCKMEFTSYYGVRKHRALEHDDVGRDVKASSYEKAMAMEQQENAANDDNESDTESLGEWLPDDYAQYKMKHTMNKMKRSQWYKCKICCAVFSNYYKLSKHKIEHQNKPNPYECNQCNDKFKDIDSLMAHIRIHQGKDPYQCKKCEKGYMTKEELDEHFQIHVFKKKPEPIKRYRCDVCGKEFSKLCDIERHTRVHTGEKPSECNICHKRFQQSHNLSKHLLIHLHVKPFQCEICNKKFGRIDVLNRHLLTHSMEKPFKCSSCGKGFIRQIQLTNHTAKYHSNSEEDS